MFQLTASNIISCVLIVFFVVGAVANWIAPPKIAADYARWGYPSFFHYVTAVLEAATAALMVFPSTRIYGAILGSLVMASAIATLARHKEYRHAIVPSIVLVACMAVIAIGR